MIKAIIFDIGGVITFSDFELLYANFANRIGISPEFVSKYNEENLPELLLGNITLEQFFGAMRDADSKEKGDLESIWIEEALKIRKVNKELLDLIDRLRKKYTIGVLSNLTPSRLIVDKAMGIYNHFDFVLLSCQEHLKKPDPKFYQLAIDRAGVVASSIIYVDDKEKYTSAAADLGFNSITYRVNKQLFEELEDLDTIFK